MSRIAPILCLTLSAGCGGSAAGGGGQGGETIVFTVGPDGGSFAQDGIGLEVPPSALSTTTYVTARFEDGVPAPLSDTAYTVGRAVRLEFEPSTRISLPVKVTVPFDRARLTGTLPPTLLDWDDASRLYWPVVVVGVDATAATLTFATNVAARVVPVAVKPGPSPGSPLPTAATGSFADLWTVQTSPPFFPFTDGLFHPNFDAYLDRGGVCLGMSVYTVWYFDTFRKRSPLQADGLYFMYRNLLDVDDPMCGNGNPDEWMDDVTVRDIAVRAHAAPADVTAWDMMELSQDPRVIPSTLLGMDFWLYLASTKAPFILLLSSGWPPPANGWHAAVAFGYEAPTGSDPGRFDVYDSNHPGTTQTLDFGPPADDPSGRWILSNYTGDPNFRVFGLANRSVLPQASLEGIHAQAAAGWGPGTSRFAAILIDSATDSAGRALTVSRQDRPWVQGIGMPGADAIRVRGHLVAPASSDQVPDPWLPAYVSWDYGPTFSRVADVASDGSFILDDPQVVTPPAKLWLVAHDAPASGPPEWRFQQEGYAGFAKVEVKLLSQPRIVVSPSSSRIQVGDKVQLTATKYDIPDGCGIVWSTWDPLVATVDQDALVTGLRFGHANIQAGLSAGPPQCPMVWGAAEVLVDVRAYEGTFGITASSVGGCGDVVCTCGSEPASVGFGGSYLVRAEVEIDRVHVRLDATESLTITPPCIGPVMPPAWSVTTDLLPDECDPGPCYVSFPYVDLTATVSRAEGDAFAGSVLHYRPHPCLCTVADVPFVLSHVP